MVKKNLLNLDLTLTRQVKILFSLDLYPIKQFDVKIMDISSCLDVSSYSLPG